LLPAEDSKQILKMETQSRSWRWRLKADLEDGDSKQILKMETQSRSWRWRLKADLEDGDSKQILKMGNIGTKCW